METFRFLLATTFYPPFHVGGDAVHVQYLAEALAARGHEVHVEFSPAAYRLKRKGAPEVPPDNGVRLHPIPSPFGRAQPVAAHQLGRSPSVSRFHERLLREIRPEVVHLHNISLLGLGVLQHPAGARVLYTAHDYWARCPRSDLLKFGKEMCSTPACARCALVSGRPPQIWRYGTRWRGLPGVDCAIAPSRFMAGAIADAVTCPVVHIPNFAPDPNPQGAVTAPEDYFLFAGVLEPHKGVRVLSAAASRLGSPPVRLVGRGSELQLLRKAAGDDHPALRIEGWVSAERLRDLYRHAQALLIPSVWPENAPLVAVEALAWGTPLLVSRRGGLEEMLDGGAAGRSFEPNPDDVLRAMTGFQEEGLASGLRESARKAYERRHRPETYLRRYLGVVRGDEPSASELGSEQSVAEAPRSEFDASPGGWPS